MSVKLGHFELHDQIGQGGMGTVFRAFDPSLNRNVAIKLLDEELAQNSKFVEEFIREAQNAAAISHPNIVQIYFVGEHENNYYLVMELLTGHSLSAIVEQDGPLAEVLALRVAIEIAEALKAAYTSNQMIHGDVKPQNIFVTYDHGSKLLDFGLAKLANVEVTVSDGVWGSAYYVSPERIGQKAEDFRSDIYSLGATIFEALVGRPPFDAPTVEELASKRLLEKPPLLRTINPNISKRTETVINKMLAKSPLLRHLDYDSLISDLRKAEASAMGGATPSSDTAPLGGRTTGHIPVVVARKSQLPLIITICTTVLLIGGALAFVMLKKNTSAPAAPTPAPDGYTLAAASATPLPATYGTKIVLFKFSNFNAKSVSLVGNFNEWRPEPMSFEREGTSAGWTKQKELPRGVPLEYQFIVDGKPVPDPNFPNESVPDGHGAEKTMLIVPKMDENTPTPTPKPRVSTTPRPTPKPRPSPTVYKPLPTPTPTPVPTPIPDAVDMNELAASPTEWPKTVSLKVAAMFPIIVGGKPSGEVQISPGMQVTVVKVEPTQVTVDFQGSTQRLPISSTDLIERVKAARKH
ncbi:MAG: protein kinase [Chthoniobacteraceae bacterium]